MDISLLHLCFFLSLLLSQKKSINLSLDDDLKKGGDVHSTAIFLRV